MAINLMDLYRKPKEGVSAKNLFSQWGLVQTPKTTPTASSVYGDWLTGGIKDPNYFYKEFTKGLDTGGGGGDAPNLLGQQALASGTWDRYQKVVSAPEKTSVQELLTKHPDAKYWSDETIQAFADNYRLGLASLNKNLSSEQWADLQAKGYIPAVEGNKYSIDYAYTGDKYNAIKDPKKIIFDPVYGLITAKSNKTSAKEGSTGLIGGIVDQFGSGPLPTLALLAAVTAPALLGGQAAAGGTAGATTGGATGLSSLPTAGTWAQTATPALGAGAGSWTLPSALTGVSGATTVAGGLTLADAIAAAPGSGTTTAGAVGTGGATSGGFNVNFPSSGGQQIMDAIPGSSDYGLNSLPNAGTMPNTSTPALGAGAGEWTLPEALTNVSGATQAASGSTLGAGLALSPGSGLTTLGGGAAATSGMSSVTDFLSNLFSKGADKFMENPLQNTVGILSALSSTSQGKDLADQLKALMNQGLSQSDPFGSQRAQYAAKLKQTYDNPNTYLGSEEYKGISRKRLEALERADAAQGRRSQYGARAEKMYEFDQENLNKERTMLAQLAGSGIQPGQVGNILSTLGAGSANAQVNANGQLYALLASMVKGS